MPRIARPWFRFYSEAADNLKLHNLPDRLVKPWLFLMCLANVNRPRGRLPAMAKVAFTLRVKEDRAEALIKSLQGVGLIDRVGSVYVMHDWDEWQAERDVAPSMRDETAEINHGNVTDTAQEGHARVEKSRRRNRSEKEREQENGERRATGDGKNVFELFDDYLGGGKLTQTLRDILIDAEERFGIECIQHSIIHAAKSSPTSRSWSFVESICLRHERQGNHSDERDQNPNGASSSQSTPAVVDDDADRPRKRFHSRDGTVIDL